MRRPGFFHRTCNKHAGACTWTLEPEAGAGGRVRPLPLADPERAAGANLEKEIPMISVDIPGWGPIRVEHIVLDYNGTLAVDGILVPGVAQRLQRLSTDLEEVHVLTADTFGKVREGMRGIPSRVSILPPGSQDQGKLEYVKALGAERVCAVGNGRNDRLMLEAAALGLAVILGEGASFATLAAADAVCLSIVDALDLLIHPLRLTATLRS